MPGYLVHLASAPEDISIIHSGRLGLLAPDLWKKQTPTEEEFNQLFANTWSNMNYNQVKFLCDLKHGGTHFGPEPSITNQTNFKLLKKACKKGGILAPNKIAPNIMFLLGYAHHLRVDNLFYADESICDTATFNADFAANEELAMKTLHSDWDKTNNAIASWYPEVMETLPKLPQNVQEIVKFTPGEPKYISLENMKKFIEKMRVYRTLSELLDDSQFSA